MSNEPTTQEASEVEDHEHRTIVICGGFGDRDDLLTYGPFESPAWANGWIQQHNHDPYVGSDGLELLEELQDKNLTDEDHYCNFFGNGWHEIIGQWVPGFDPTTLPVPVE